jgi:mercuric ion transport protein
MIERTTPQMVPGFRPEHKARRAALLNYFSLFSSFSTLLCCALPSILVLLGMGTAVASLLSAAPWLVNLSRHKIWTFSIAGTLIAASFVMTYVIAPRLQAGARCEADDPTTCGEVSKGSRVVLWGSALIWCCGFFVAYLLGPILERIDR